VFFFKKIAYQTRMESQRADLGVFFKKKFAYQTQMESQQADLGIQFVGVYMQLATGTDISIIGSN